VVVLVGWLVGCAALNSLRVQFLYDEIEAEVNLAFDQLAYKLSEAVYGHFKQTASRSARCLRRSVGRSVGWLVGCTSGGSLRWSVVACSLQLEKAYKTYAELIFPVGRFQAPKSRFDVLLKQRHVQLLGRSVDLNHLIAQRMNGYLRQNIDYAITRFEVRPRNQLYGARIHTECVCVGRRRILLAWWSWRIS
jgi:cytoplasmic FMR1 interacting protein